MKTTHKFFRMISQRIDDFFLIDEVGNFIIDESGNNIVGVI